MAYKQTPGRSPFPKTGRDIPLNFLSNRTCKLSYIIESGNWSIRCDGKYISKNLNKFGLIKTNMYICISNQL